VTRSGKVAMFASAWRQLCGRSYLSAPDASSPRYDADDYDRDAIVFGLSSRCDDQTALVSRRVRTEDLTAVTDPVKAVAWLRRVESALLFELDVAVRTALGIRGET
jgi:hypothetical protein